MANIKSDDMAKAIVEILEQYKDTTVETMKNAVDTVSKKAVRELKQTSPRMTGAYAKDWAQKKQPQTKQYAYAKVVYNKKHYRLTHLLEKGHKVKPVPKHAGKKTTVGPQDHIGKVEKESIDEFTRLIKEGV